MPVTGKSGTDDGHQAHTATGIAPVHPKVKERRPGAPVRGISFAVPLLPKVIAGVVPQISGPPRS